MSTELSTAKYLAPEVAQVPLSDNAELAPVATTQAYAPGDVTSHLLARQKPKWTIGLTVIAVLLGLFGLSGVFSGAMGAVGQYSVTNADSTTALGQYSGQGQQAVILERTLANLKQFSTVIYLQNGICVLVGIGFLLSCALLLIRRADANSIASTACIAAIFYNCLTFVVTWVTMPSFGGIPELPEGAASIAMGFAIGVTAIVTLFKIAMYVGFAAYFSSSNIKAIFAPAEQLDAPTEQLDYAG